MRLNIDEIASERPVASMRGRVSLGWPARIFLHGVRTVQRWQRRRTMDHFLAGLNDHMLKDMGLQRSEIRSPVEERVSPRRYSS